MVFDLVELATTILTVFVIARVLMGIPPIRRLAERLLVGREGELE